MSFVVTSRNDDHGGDMVRRFQVFVECLMEQVNRHHLSGELIVVEWNPPPAPRLHEILKLRIKSDLFAIRFIEVPAEVHRTIRNSDVIPLFQMIAKNVGIRRARGEFVVATNPDLLFSDALVSFLASGELQNDVMYRINREDVPAEIPVDVSLDEQLAWCAAHVLRVHRRRGTFSRGIHDVLRAVREKGLFRAGVSYWPLRILRQALWVAVKYIDPLPKIHTNGCGDFTLLSRDQWFALRGYPELSLWSMHIDSLFCYMAVASGLRERVLRPPARIFHLEHQNSWVVMSPEERLRTFALKPWIDVDLLSALWDQMYRTRRPIEFNKMTWGFADLPLDEVRIQSGEQRFIRSGAPVMPPGRD